MSKKRKNKKNKSYNSHKPIKTSNNLNILSEEDIQKSLNEYMESNNGFTEAFNTNLFSDGILKTAKEQTIKDWFSNPEANKSNIEKLTTYFYIANPNIFQLYDTTKILPSLNYKIKSENKEDNYKDNISIIKLILKQIKHKRLTRELITQVITSGTLCGLWIGTKKKPYLYVFDNLEYVFPAYRKQGEWVLWVDLKWFDSMNELERIESFNNLKPYITENDYKLYKKDSQKVRYVELPQDRSVCLRTHTLFVNQRFGIPWATQSFFDILHKEKLKALEKSISNKVINSVAVLTLGNKDFTDAKISKKKQRAYRGVKKALEKNSNNGVTVVGIPHWTDLKFPDIKTDGLDPKKFDSANDDINSASSGMMSIINGKGNFSSGKLSLDIMYKKIAVLLEDIEEEVYQKMINWILGKKKFNIYSMEYDKKVPLSTKEKMQVLEKLNTTFGMSLKAVIDNIEGVDFDNYIEDSIYEQEVLKLQERIKPYSSAYTQTDKKNGRSETDEVDNPSTEQTKTDSGNEKPKPSTE